LVIDGLTIHFADEEPVEEEGEPSEVPADEPVDEPAQPSSEVTINISGKDLDTVLQEIDATLTRIQVEQPALLSSLDPVHTVIGTTISIGTINTNDGRDNGMTLELVDGDFAADLGKDLSVSFQIGANEGERMSL